MYFFCACEKNHKKIRSSYLVQKAFSKINLTVLMKVTEQLYCRKKFVWLLPFYMAVATYFYYQQCAKPCVLQLYHTFCAYLL